MDLLKIWHILKAKHVTKGHLPEITMLKMRPSIDTFIEEAFLHSMLAEYKCGDDLYCPTQEQLVEAWGSV